MNARAEVVRTIKSAKEKKGRESEMKADLALDWLQENGKILTWWENNYDQDRYEGIDRFVLLKDGRESKLQIKSSRSGFDHAIENYPDIPCIIVNDEDEIDRLAWRILGVLNKN